MTAETSVDFVLEKMTRLLNSEDQLIHFDKDQLQSIYKGMQLMRHFLREYSEGKRNHDNDGGGDYYDEAVKDVKAKIRDVAWKVDDAIDLVWLNTDQYLLGLGTSGKIDSIGDDDRIFEGNSHLKLRLLVIKGLCLAIQRVAKSIRRILDGIREEIQILMTSLMGIHDDIAEPLRLRFNEALKDIDCFKTEVETWLHSVHRQFNSSQNDENEDASISMDIETFHQSLSSLYYRFAGQFRCLSDLFGFLNNVDFSLPVFTKPIDIMTKYEYTQMRKWENTLSQLHRRPEEFDRFRHGFGRLIEEMKCFKKEMEIDGRRSSQVRDGFGRLLEKRRSMETEMEFYRNESSLLLWNLFYEAILGAMEFIKTKIKVDASKISFGRRRIFYGNIDTNLNLFCSSCEKALNRAQKIFVCFGGVVEAISIEGRAFLSSLHSLIVSQFNFLFDLLDFTGQYDDCSSFGSMMGNIMSIKKEVDIYGEKLDLSWPGSEEAYDILKRVYLAHILRSYLPLFEEYELKFIVQKDRNRCGNAFNSCLFNYKFYLSFELFAKICGSAASFVDETICMMKELVIYQKGRLKSLTAEKICCCFSGIVDDIESIKTEAMEIHEKMKKNDIQVQPPSKSSSRAWPMPNGAMAGEETIVGFDDQKVIIMDFLTRGHGKQLKFIQIVGMPGLGKTTLAINIYCDPLVVHHFYICAWVYVSQACQERELLLRILFSTFKLGDEICEMSTGKLGEELYKRLKGKRYLIVMDDIWNITVWNDLKRWFPDDKNGSRILFTSRLEVIDAAKSHHLRFLNEDESWILLQQRIFGRENCPQELFEIGKQIAKKCRGLPLAIVVLSGLLAKNEKTLHWWTHVAQSASSYIATDEEQYMDTLALSYNHLPHHLKPFFLYFGAFPKGYEIPVWRLIWLWIAERFISQHQQKGLEEVVVEDYLRDLIDRNLVLVSKKKSNGGIKTCHVHDLLHDLCLKKAQEENFLIQLRPYEQVSSSSRPSSLMTNKCRRICVQSDDYIPSSWLFHGFPVRSFLSFYQSLDHLFMLDVLFVFLPFKFLRVLDLSSVRIIAFPVEVTHLCHLRYLALRVGELDYLKLPVANLQNLETLVVDGEPRSFLVFDDFWKMANLRHLYAKQLIEIPSPPDDGCPFALDRLQTICKLDLRGLDGEILRRIPHLRKLKCSFMQLWGDSHIFPKLKFLLHLENLNVIYDGFQTCPRRFPNIVEFPPNLKSLTLLNFCLPWEEMSTLGRLPNLEILKLSYKAFKGPRWDTGEREFLKLKFLKFRGLDIRRWYASSIHFPNLQTLVLEDCKQLEEIPRDLGYISALETIELWYCSSGAVNSAKLIGNQQLSMGNDGLKILIHPYHYEVSESEDEEDAD